jgi:hypothetical protein
MDERAFELWGVPLSEYVTFDDLSAHVHPADRDRVKAAFAATRAIVGAYEIDFRIMIGHEVRWISARGQGNDADIVGRVMHGIFIDVTGRKQAEEGHELLAGEMSHRVKNLLAIAAGLTAITSRSAKNYGRHGTGTHPSAHCAEPMILSVRFRVRKEKRRCWATCSQYYLRLMTIWVRSAAAFASQCRAWGSGNGRRRRLRSSCTNLRLSLSSMARYLRPPELSTFRVRLMIPK